MFEKIKIKIKIECQASPCVALYFNVTKTAVLGNTIKLRFYTTGALLVMSLGFRLTIDPARTR